MRKTPVETLRDSRTRTRGLSLHMLVTEILMIALVNAIIDTVIVLVILSKRQERMMGVTKVEQGGKMIYAPLGPDNEPIQVPIGMKEVDGVQTPVMGYAGLGYTLPYIAAEMATMKIKMAMLNTKSQISKQLKRNAMGAVASGEITLEDAMASGVVPKGMQDLYAKFKMAQSLLGGLGAVSGPTAQNSPQAGVRPRVEGSWRV